MVNKKLGVVILLVLLVIPMVLAVTTTINVKTLAEHDIEVKVVDPNPSKDKSNLLEYFSNNTGDNGEVSFIHSSNKNKISIIVILRKDGKKVEINGETIHEFKDRSAGAIINLKVEEELPEPVVLEINETEEVIGETEETEEEVEEEKEGGKMTGAVTDKRKIFTPKIMFYIIGVVLILGILIFLILMAKKKLKSKKGGAYLDFKVKPEGDEPKVDARILDVNEKIKTAAKELDDIMGEK